MRTLEEQEQFLTDHLKAKLGAKRGDPGDQAEVSIGMLPLEALVRGKLPDSEILSFEIVIEMNGREPPSVVEFEAAAQDCFVEQGYRVATKSAANFGSPLFSFLVDSDDSEGFVMVCTGTLFPDVRLASIMLAQKK